MTKRPNELDPHWVQALRRRGEQVRIDPDAWARITTRPATPLLPPNGRRVAQLAVIAFVGVALIATALLVRARSHDAPIQGDNPSRTTAPTAPPKTQAQPARGLFQTRWVLATARDHGCAVALLGRTQRAHVTFVRTRPCDPTGCRKGPSVSGDDGCNDYFADLTIHGSNITSQSLAGSLVSCSGPSLLISNVFIPKVPLKYRIIGDRLQLTSTDGTALTYRASP